MKFPTARVWQNNSNKQLLVTIPARCGIQKGDMVEIRYILSEPKIQKFEREVGSGELRSQKSPKPKIKMKPKPVRKTIQELIKPKTQVTEEPKLDGVLLNIIYEYIKSHSGCSDFKIANHLKILVGDVQKYLEALTIEGSIKKDIDGSYMISEEQLE